MKKKLLIIFTIVFLVAAAGGYGAYRYLYQDFTGRPYSEIAAYAEKHPYVHISYTVPISNGNEDLLLNQDSRSVYLDSVARTESLIAHSEYLQNLHTIDLRETALTGELLKQLHLAFPNSAISYSKVDVLGTVQPKSATELDLSAITADRIPAVITDLTFLTKIQTINLMPAEGAAQLGFDEVKQLMEARPEVRYNYHFDFYGQTIDLYQERVEYVQVEMGDGAADQLRAVLDFLPNCSYFKLDRCGFTSPVLDQINKDFPDTKVVWRVFYGNNFNAMTDETVIRSSHHLRNYNVAEMKYLNDVVYMDIGHNDTLRDLSFLQYMPKLKLLILSGGLMQDLSGLAGNTNLEFLELCFCSHIADLTPLKDCTGLKYLNISGTAVTDISPVMDLPLERFVNMLNPKQDQTMKDSFAEAHPDCIYVTQGKQPYGYGWRYIDEGYNFNDYYKTMREIFHYDQENLLNGYEWDRVTANDPY